jgi:hypothetical protein
MKMKTRTKQCGVFAALAAVLLVSAALVTSCPEALDFGGLKAPQEQELEPFVPPEGMGFIRFSIDDDSPGRSARTAIPAALYVDRTDFAKVEVTLTGATSTNDQTIPSWDGTPIAKVPDTYKVTVIGYDASDVAVATGEKIGVIVSANTGTPATVDMKEIVDGSGNGTFSWDLDNTFAATTATMKIVGLSSGAEHTHDAYYTGVTNGELVAGGELTGSVTLKSGYYRMELALVKANHKSATVLEILHIWNGHDTEYEKELSLNANVHTITYNWNDGRTGGSAYSTTKPFTHGTALTHPGAGAGTAPVYNDGTVDDPAQIFQGWYTTASAGDLWAIGTKLVLRSQALFAHWGSAPPFQGITLTLDFKYTGEPTITIGVTNKVGGATVNPGSLTIDPYDPPTLVLTATVPGTLTSPTYSWSYDQGTLSPANAVTQDLDFGSVIDFTNPGTHNITLIVTSGGTPYTKHIAIEVSH